MRFINVANRLVPCGQQEGIQVAWRWRWTAQSPRGSRSPFRWRSLGPRPTCRHLVVQPRGTSPFCARLRKPHRGRLGLGRPRTSLSDDVVQARRRHVVDFVVLGARPSSTSHPNHAEFFFCLSLAVPQFAVTASFLPKPLAPIAPSLAVKNHPPAPLGRPDFEQGYVFGCHLSGYHVRSTDVVLQGPTERLLSGLPRYN